MNVLLEDDVYGYDNLLLKDVAVVEDFDFIKTLIDRVTVNESMIVECRAGESVVNSFKNLFESLFNSLDENADRVVLICSPLFDSVVKSAMPEGHQFSPALTGDFDGAGHTYLSGTIDGYIMVYCALLPRDEYENLEWLVVNITGNKTEVKAIELTLN